MLNSISCAMSECVRQSGSSCNRYGFGRQHRGAERRQRAEVIAVHYSAGANGCRMMERRTWARTPAGWRRRRLLVEHPDSHRVHYQTLFPHQPALYLLAQTSQTIRLRQQCQYPSEIQHNSSGWCKWRASAVRVSAESQETMRSLRRKTQRSRSCAASTLRCLSYSTDDSLHTCLFAAELSYHLKHMRDPPHAHESSVRAVPL